MTAAQKYILWGTAVLVWTFGLSIVLSAVAYGYVDPPTVYHMTLVLAPLLIVAAVLLVVFRRPRGLRAKEERPARVGPAVTEETT